jgi:hypothetical protein
MARGRKSSLCMVLSPEERQTWARWPRSTTLAAGLARRGKRLLLLAAGSSQADVAQAVGVPRTAVRQWARRCLAQRLEGLADAPGRGAQGGVPPRGGHPRGALRLRATRFTGPPPLPRGGPPNWRASASRRGAWRPASAATGRRMLACPRLKPGPPQLWLYPTRPREPAF